MKTCIRIILVVALLLGTRTGYADVNIETPLKLVSGELTLDKVKKGHEVVIKDVSNSIIYSEKINYDGIYSHTFNLKSLKDGLYTIEFNKDFEINIKAFVVTSGSVTFIADAERTIFKPVFRVENSRILISQLTLDGQPLDIKIYFENELILTETLDGDRIINRVYNLKEKVNGDYKVVMKSNGRTYRKVFRI